MATGCFADRIGDLVDLSASERATLIRLEERERSVKRGAVLQRENEPASEIFIVSKGMMMSYVLMDDGSRQVLRFLLPGDMFGTSGLAYSEATESVSALTDCTVCPFDRSALAELMIEHPRLSALILVHHHMDRSILTDRLAALGRTGAKARVAALLLEMRDRLRRNDRSIGSSFAIGLTQEEIGDATGLTAVHVNRMLRQLEEDRLIARSNGHITLSDEPRLKRVANYVDRYGKLDLGWLPPST